MCGEQQLLHTSTHTDTTDVWILHSEDARRRHV